MYNEPMILKIMTNEICSGLIGGDSAERCVCSRGKKVTEISFPFKELV